MCKEERYVPCPLCGQEHREALEGYGTGFFCPSCDIDYDIVEGKVQVLHTGQ